MRRFLARLARPRGCPACMDRRGIPGTLRTQDGGYLECEDCHVVVVPDRGGWRYAMESRLRQLPGLAGLPFVKQEDAA